MNFKVILLLDVSTRQLVKQHDWKVQ